MATENEDKRLQNLKPFQKGQSGNPKGRPKGIKNWSTVIQSLLADEDLILKILPSKPTYWDALPAKNGANLVVVAMMIKAMEGDNRAADWLRKSGFGDKVDLTSAGERMTTTPVIVSQILPREVSDDDVTTETDTTEDN